MCKRQHSNQSKDRFGLPAKYFKKNTMSTAEMNTVTSELYAEKPYISNSKPTFNKNNVVSKFSFALPPSSPKFDKDGDLIVDRKPNKKDIEIEHSDRTGLDLVGLQIWRGALLLADYLIYNNKDFSNIGKILELGTGVGLTGIVAAMYSPVICTDINKGGILQLIQNNVQRNKTFVQFPIETLELDFTLPFSGEIIKVLPEVKVILAADVIYDDDITTAFVDTLVKLLKNPPNRTILIALEKRYVFMVDDLMTNAPCYDYFVDCLQQLKAINCKFEMLSTDFPQYFDYDRVKQLVLWKITSNHK